MSRSGSRSSSDNVSWYEIGILLILIGLTLILIAQIQKLEAVSGQAEMECRSKSGIVSYDGRKNVICLNPEGGYIRLSNQ